MVSVEYFLRLKGVYVDEKENELKSRSILLSFMLGVSVLTAGCSFAISFDIGNSADRVITIRYSLKGSTEARFPRLVVDPETDGGSKYSEFPEERIKRDIEKRVCEFTLLPGEEAEVLSMHDRETNEYEKDFAIGKLYISDGEGSITLEGDEIFKKFRPIKRSWYAFGPEIIGFMYEYR